MSFTRNSYILFGENGKITIEIISLDNKCETIELNNIGDDIFNTWKPQKIAEDTFVARFNSDFWNGWLTIKRTNC